MKNTKQRKERRGWIVCEWDREKVDGPLGWKKKKKEMQTKERYMKRGRQSRWAGVSTGSGHIEFLPDDVGSHYKGAESDEKGGEDCPCMGDTECSIHVGFPDGSDLTGQMSAPAPYDAPNRGQNSKSDCCPSRPFP